LPKISALALKDLLKMIKMELVTRDFVIENGKLIKSRPYYMVYYNAATLAILNQKNKDANWYKWRRR